VILSKSRRRNIKLDEQCLLNTAYPNLSLIELKLRN
jgi:hypothetical protein